MGATLSCSCFSEASSAATDCCSNAVAAAVSFWPIFVSACCTAARDACTSASAAVLREALRRRHVRHQPSG